MMTFERLQSARDALSDFTADGYQIFHHDEREKRVTLWQPSGTVTNLEDFPSPQGMREKAESFLKTAKNDGCDLAAAPEWGYNLEWITDHEKYLFAHDSPLFVLGCAPVLQDDISTILDHLTDDEGYDLLTPEGDFAEDRYRVSIQDGKKYVIPTIIPIKPAAVSGDQKTVLLQFKNAHMSSRLYSTEERNLATGEKVWRLDPRGVEMELLVWTCADILDTELREEGTEFARRKDSIIAHVQVNPDPFNKRWIGFRKEAFDTDSLITYLNVNWGLINGSMYCGYSGVFTKAIDSTVLADGYNRTCKRGGIAGTDPEVYYEYVCSVSDNVINKFKFARKDSNTSPAGNPRMANLQIVKTWEYEKNCYQQNDDFQLQNQPDVCTEWRDQLDLDSVDEEVMLALLRGEISTEGDPESFKPKEHITWASLRSFHATGVEDFAPLLRFHERRKSDTKHRPSKREHPSDIVEYIKQGTEHAEDARDIVIKEDFDVSETPINARYANKDVSVLLTLLELGGEKKELQRAKWLFDWWQRTHERSENEDEAEAEDEKEAEDEDEGTSKFRPVAVVNQFSGPALLKTLEGCEDPTEVPKDPERADATTGLTKLL